MRVTHGITAALMASFSGASAAACSKQSLLLVSSYPAGENVGGITRLKLGNKGLEQVGEVTDICGTHPSWQTLSGSDQYYCIDENWPGLNGTLTSAKIGADGNLTKLGSKLTAYGPVHVALYGEGGKGIVTANYGSGTIDIFRLDVQAEPQATGREDFPPSPANVEVTSKPHQGVVDPTGEFIVVPDLGLDVLRIFGVDQTSLALTELAGHNFENGTGPRHVAFLKSDSRTFLYVISEIKSTIIGFEVSYGSDSLTLSQIFDIRTDNTETAAPVGSSGAEITISPDNKFLTVSTRNDTKLEYTLFNGKKIQSDPLNTFSIDAATGQLTHVQTAPAGGLLPRHFSFNKDGSLVAVACGGPEENRVVVFQRDVATGKIGRAVGERALTNQPNHVIFKEDADCDVQTEDGQTADTSAGAASTAGSTRGNIGIAFIWGVRMAGLFYGVVGW